MWLRLRGRLETCKERRMLYTIAGLLLILWVLGLVSSYTLGGFIHLFLLVAIIVTLIRMMRGENPFA